MSHDDARGDWDSNLSVGSHAQTAASSLIGTSPRDSGTAGLREIASECFLIPAGHNMFEQGLNLTI